MADVLPTAGMPAVTTSVCREATTRFGWLYEADQRLAAADRQNRRSQGEHSAAVPRASDRLALHVRDGRFDRPPAGARHVHAEGMVRAKSVLLPVDDDP